MMGMLLLGGGCGWATAQTVRRVMAHEYDRQQPYARVYQWCSRGLPWVGELSKILENKTFIVLLQNSNELRASGGFMGSYMRIKTDPQGIEDIHVQDIYVPDGQLPGHVDPPYPIQEAFGQGWWKLRDANWDVDYASTAATVKWFFEQGGEKQVDGLVAINLQLVKKVLGVLGGVKLATYDDFVTEKNIDQLAQKYAEIGFKPGSTQKRDFLGAVGEQLKMRLGSMRPKEAIKLGKLVYSELKRGEILLWFADTDWQDQARLRHWAGVIRPLLPETDFLYMSEANLGANKANCCVSRRVKQEVQNLTVTTTIEWTNSNPFETPRPPVFWGGDYRNYVRLVLPGNVDIQDVRVGERSIRRGTDEDFLQPVALRQKESQDIYIVEKRSGYTLIGLWAFTPANTSTSLTVVRTTIDQHRPYKVYVQRQPGVGTYPFTLVVDGRLVGETMIDRDQIVTE